MSGELQTGAPTSVNVGPDFESFAAFWEAQETSGNLSDSIGAFGAPVYQEAVAGWSRAGISTAVRS